jgi:hypothetical protein
LRPSRYTANRGSEARRIAPSNYRQALLAHNALQNSFALQALVFLDRQERHANAIKPGLGQIESEFATLPHKKLMRNLKQDASPIASFGIASAGPAMRQVQKNLDALRYDFVTFVAADVGNKSNPTGVMLLRGMIQTLGRRWTIRNFLTLRHHLLCDTALLAANVAACRPPGLESRLHSQQLRDFALVGSGIHLCQPLSYCHWKPKVQRRISIERIQISGTGGRLGNLDGSVSSSALQLFAASPWRFCR